MTPRSKIGTTEKARMNMSMNPDAPTNVARAIGKTRTPTKMFEGLNERRRRSTGAIAAEVEVGHVTMI